MLRTVGEAGVSDEVAMTKPVEDLPNVMGRKMSEEKAWVVFGMLFGMFLGT